MCFLLESTYIFIGPVDTAYRGEQECVWAIKATVGFHL